MSFAKVIFVTIFGSAVLALSLSSYAQSKFSVGINAGIGHDFQTRSNDFNLTGPIVLPASDKNSILHIEKPYFFSVKTAYELNKSVSLLMDLGTANRALRYWSLDDRVEDYSYLNDKIALGIRTFSVATGIRLQTNLSSKVNLFWDQTFGISFGRSSPRFSLDKNDPQAELIYLNDREVGLLVNVNLGSTAFSLNSGVGVKYNLMKKIDMTLGLQFSNQLSSVGDIIVWGYDLDADRRSGGYSPYDLEFKSLISELGLIYRL